MGGSTLMPRLRAPRRRDGRCATSRGFLILPGELAKHAVSEGTKAVTKFEAATSKK